MPSITIRQLDDALKRRLRLRAARNGRSMEDEARTILRDAAAIDGADHRESQPEARGRERATSRSRVPAGRPVPAVPDANAISTKRILLIIGGGIAAYK